MRLGRVVLVVAVACVAAWADERSPRDARPTKRLVFAPPPAGWTPHVPTAAEKASGRTYAFDFDLPAAAASVSSGDAARVNVIHDPVGFDEYRTRILKSWAPLRADDQAVWVELETDAVKARAVEQAGTYHRQGEPAREGWRLVAVHLRVPGGQWSAWLIGSDGEVRAHKAAFLAWVRTVSAHDLEPEPEAIRETRAIHGAPPHGVPGPWALAGWRIGRHARERLGVKDAWELVVTHRTPREVRYACVADGVQAATGCSPGKLNLVLETVDSEEKLETVVKHRSGRTLTYRLTPAFRERFAGTDYAAFPDAAKQLLAMKDDELFTVTE